MLSFHYILNQYPQSLVDLFTKLHQDFLQGISALKSTNSGLKTWNISSISPDIQELSPQPTKNDQCLQEELSQLRTATAVQLSSTPIEHHQYNSIVMDTDHSQASTGEDMDISLGDEIWNTYAGSSTMSLTTSEYVNVSISITIDLLYR